ncbi:MAG: hypothetical protein KF796_19360 [Ramlibacter sp.]|nr:hypothetical protein [Ramlibacter sp.]
MLVETGILPIGLTVGGERHQAFELRPPTVEDNIIATQEVADMADGAARGLKLTVAVLARQFVKLGTLPQEAISLEMVLGLHPNDLDALYDAEARLKKKLLSGGLPWDGGSQCEPGAPNTA